MSLQPLFITGWGSGLQTNKKPFLLPDEAFPVLENAYTWRERVRKREGLKFLGRLRRMLEAQALGMTDGAGNFTGNIRAILSWETNAEIDPGSLVITIGAQTITDQGNGLLAGDIAATGTINYSTTAITIVGADINAAITADVNYFPSLPVMGIPLREIATVNDEQTIWFDTKYAYIWTGASTVNSFEEFIPGTTWAGTDSDFFWAYNYRGTQPQDRLFFVTNFSVTPASSANPIRYTDGSTWTDFAPLISATDTLYQARIIIAYYGRLLMLNTYEGTTMGGYAGAVNIFNRCRFSQIGSPVAADAWRQDIFGRGGFLDAPVNEEIIGAIFIKNTLVVTFERSTWQLRYLGEYGLPFIWERVSADFGSESTFSGILFDNKMLAIGDKAIIAANAIGADRIDLDIPDQIFQFKNANNGVKRVFGIRDYQREIAFWNYADSQTQASPGVALTFPNKVLLYNYRNNTWAIFRDSVTAFGVFQTSENITWSNTAITWDDEDYTWDDFDTQSEFPAITSGNQQGFVHLYGYVTPDEPSLTIEAIDLTTTPIQITSVNHNLQPEEIIYITDLQFLNSGGTVVLPTDLNDKTYQVAVLSPDVISISKWNTVTQQYENNFAFTPVTSALYVGGGQMTLFPKLNVQTKDINIYQSKGMNVKLSYIDFLMEATPSAAMSVILFINSSPSVKGNLLVGQKNMSTALTTSFYPPASDYSWFRFYATLNAQYFNIDITYDDDLMNNIETHRQKWTMLAINAWLRPGGRNPF